MLSANSMKKKYYMEEQQELMDHKQGLTMILSEQQQIFDFQNQKLKV